jgi:hypothetical protein
VRLRLRRVLAESVTHDNRGHPHAALGPGSWISVNARTDSPGTPGSGRATEDGTDFERPAPRIQRRFRRGVILCGYLAATSLLEVVTVQ